MTRLHQYINTQRVRVALASFAALAGLLAAQIAPASVYAACSASCDASMSASPSSKTYAPGDTVTVSVYVNTGGHSVNAVQADFTYTSSRLTYKSIDASASAFGINASSTGGGGSVSISRGNISPVSGSTVLVAKVKFAAKSNNDGKAYITFGSSSTVADSSSNLDILGSKNGATYTIKTPTPPSSDGGSSGGSSGGSTTTTTTNKTTTSTTPTTTTTNKTTQQKTTTKPKADTTKTDDTNTTEETTTEVATEPEAVSSAAEEDSFMKPVAMATIGVGAILAAVGVFIVFRLFARHRSAAPYQSSATGSAMSGAAPQSAATVMPSQSEGSAGPVGDQPVQSVKPDQATPPAEAPSSDQKPPSNPTQQQ